MQHRAVPAGPSVPSRLRTTLLAGGLVMLAASASPAQTIDVPTFVAGTPTFQASLQEADVAAQPGGGFVVIWDEFGATLGASNRIVDHYFSRDGVPKRPPVRVDASGYGLYPHIVADGDGGFVASWDWPKEGVARALYTRRLDNGGVPISGETRVDTPNTGPVISSAVACRDSGCIYFWKQNGLWVRAYDHLGTPTTGAISVGVNTPGFELDIDVLPDGGFVLVWTNFFLADYSWARIYHADMTPAGPAFVVDSTGVVDEVAVSRAGEIAIVGHAFFDETTGGAGGARSETWLRRYEPDGTPIGDRSVVRTTGANIYLKADDAYDSHGNLLVVWREYDNSTNVMLPPHARAYNSAGTALGPDFELSDAPAAEIQTTVLADDCFANAWYAYSKVYANVLCLCGGNQNCGDGSTDASCEICDDGNDIEGDGCDSNCTASACGNGVVAPEEACDDGNLANGDGCDSNCTVTACGNGVVVGDEQCDDGNAVDGDGCDANCRPSGCGNGSTGDGEQCDDGNTTNGDGCDTDCTTSRCGNGIKGGSEACDDGNDVSGDGCDSNCTLSACGNGILVGEEECDDGNRTSGDGCDKACLVESCGNGRQEANEQCDGDASCNPDCTLRAEHDSVVFAIDPVAVSIPVGNDPFSSLITVQVQNADVNPRESPGHTIRLTASDGDCPEGTLTHQPDFDRGAPGIQDTAVVPGGVPSTAIAEVTVSRDAFAPFDQRVPERCTLWFSAVEATGASVDPTPDNNVVAVHLDVTDTDDAVHTDEDEFFVESMAPITVKIPAGTAVMTKKIKPSVRRSRNIPSTAADLEVTVSVSDGDCPPGTVGYVDFDRSIAGLQSHMMLRRGKRAKGSLGLSIRADAFDSPSDEAPRRCTALITATGIGDTDPSNNTTRLVIDVVDRNDF